MRVCLIYSGWLRTYQKCISNHIENLIADEITCVHINESNTNIDFHKEDIERYNEHKAGETVVRHTMNQWRNNYKAFKKAKKDCDIYVRMRYDVLLTGKINFKDYEIKDDLIYIGEGHNYRDGINDMLAFGNYNTMQKYYSLYLNHAELFDKGILFHTETFVKHNLINQGVEIRILNASTQILRK